jgi:GNAT superfamily N-acetyltransferase
MGSRVRRACPDDARGIAEVHVATWRAAYEGIVPQAHLDGLSVDRRAAQWAGWFSGPGNARMHVWVAEEDDDAPPAGARRIVGFVNVGPSRDEGAAASTGELRAIYVLRSHWDTGAGRALHEHGIASLRDSGFADATLWVLSDNPRARRFYERCGWTLDPAATKDLEILGTALREVRYRIALGGAGGAASSGPPGTR